MPLPQVNERIKEVPAQALRAVFAGIGQLLLVADKIRNRTAEQASTPTPASAAPAEAPATAPAAAPSAGSAESAESAESTKTDSARWRSLDETGNVRLISEADQATPSTPDAAAPDAAGPAAKAPPAKAPPADAPTGEVTTGEVPAAETAEVPPVEAPAAEVPPTPPAPAAPEPAPSGELPLSNYDELTIPSLRARMRVLSAVQVTALLDHEKTTQARAAVITMFERRLAKLEQEDS